MEKVEELAQRREIFLASGGQNNVQIQRNLNKMTARERINLTLDEGSFVEIGAMVNGNGAGVITGYGTVNGRLVYIYSQDFTVDGGIINLKSSNKIINIMEMALKMGAPIIQIIDSAGVKLSEGLDILARYGKMINMNAKLSGIVPQIAVIAGPCSGISAISTAMCDIAIISESSGEVYVNSPDTISEDISRFIDKEMYSQGENSVRNGSVQINVADEKKALGIVRKLIDYLPSNNIEFAPIINTGSKGLDISDGFDKLVSDSKYDIREIIRSLIDNDSEIEINQEFSETVVTSLGRINGLVVGIVATNKINNEGRLDIKACEKITRFAKFCDSFNISLISLVDTKGFIADIRDENEGLALSAAKMIYALSDANVPKTSVIIGEAYGAAYVSLASKESIFDITFAWPGSKIAISEPDKIVAILNKEEIASSEIPKLKREELIKRYIDERANSYRAAEEGYIDEVIAPSETSARLFAALDMLQSKRMAKYPKKHGSTLI